MVARGIRCKNPGNIDKGQNWQGLSEIQSDSRFCTFESMVYGCRALIKLLATYHNKYNLDTVADIINRWAPPNENNTDAYINSVSKALNVEPEEKLNLSTNTERYLQIAKAIARHENGKDASVITEDEWQQAYNMVF